MLFKGTLRRTAKEIAQEMDAIGGQMNAFTAKECTCYYAKVMDEHFPKAIDLLSDLLLHARLDPAEFEKERGVILEEISMVEDTPEDLVHELLSEAHYQGQALAMPILGPANRIRAATPESLAAFRDAHYRPENTVLAVAGNYRLEDLRALAEASLGDWTAAVPQPTPMSLPEGCARGGRWREKDIEQTHLCLGYPGVPQGSPDIYAISILNNLLGGGMSSRLFQKIREELGMAYAVYSYPSMYPGTGMFTIYAGASPENAEKVLEQVAGEIGQLLDMGVTEQEFEQAREQRKGNDILGLESASSRLSSIGRGKLLLARALGEEVVLASSAAVTREDVTRVARDVLGNPCSAALVGREVGGLAQSKALKSYAG
jgi:predicted Zn-dependent peptidase